MSPISRPRRPKKSATTRATCVRLPLPLVDSCHPKAPAPEGAVPLGLVGLLSHGAAVSPSASGGTGSDMCGLRRMRRIGERGRKPPDPCFRPRIRGLTPPRSPRILPDECLDRRRFFHAGELLIQAVVAIREAVVIDAEQLQERGVEVVDVARILHD